MNCIDVSQRNDLLAECKNEALSYFSYSYNSTLDNYVDENGYYDINEFHVDFIKGYKFYEFIYEDEKIEDEYIEQKFSYEQADVLEDLVTIFTTEVPQPFKKALSSQTKQSASVNK